MRIRFLKTIIFSLILTTCSVEAWWNSSWLYRKPIELTNSGSATSDHQIKIIVDTASLVAAGKMQSDGDDIRVLAADDSTQLSLWIEPGTMNTSQTVLWTKAPSIPMGDSTIFMYYGNDQASGVSNVQNVVMRIIGSLDALYHFDGNFNDFSGNGRHLTNHGISFSSSGKHGQSLSLDGNNDYAWSDDWVDGRYNNNNPCGGDPWKAWPITLAAWINPDQQAGMKIIADRHSDSNNWQYSLQLNSNGQAQSWVHTYGGPTQHHELGSYSTGSWNFAAMYYRDQCQRYPPLRVFLNGSYTDERGGTNGLHYNQGTRFQIGDVIQSELYM